MPAPFVTPKKPNPEAVAPRFKAEIDEYSHMSTAEMADWLGVSSKLLLRIRKMPNSPFIEGTHFFHAGITTAAPLRWVVRATEEAFKSFKRLDPSQIETMEGN